MSTFIFIMMLIMLFTLIVWHLYNNKDLREYTKKRRLFMRIISTEVFIIVIVLIIAMIFDKQ